MLAWGMKQLVGVIESAVDALESEVQAEQGKPG
jgi:hypothetical protein